VAVAHEIALALQAPFDVCIVRKIDAPRRPELDIGAVAEDGSLVLQRDLIVRLGVSSEELSSLVASKQAEVQDRVRRLRRGAPPIEVRDRTLLVVDDGVTAGATARAALQVLRARGAGQLVLAVPVGVSDALDELAWIADEIVCLYREEAAFAVGLRYEDVAAPTDDEVVSLLDDARSDAFWQHQYPSPGTRSAI
jgi:putative phosphoribosyl transferase